jgi:hypothetical protein
MKEILIIVDMQPYFTASNDGRTLEANLRQINRAKAKQCPIIVLQYGGYGVTHDCIVKELADYDAIYRTKQDDDGSDLVELACIDYGWEPDCFRITGVNADACVRLTAIGVADKFPNAKIKIVRHACNDYELGDNYWKNATWIHGNISLIPRFRKVA